MSGRASDWLAAASCCEGPAPAATYADLPREYREDLIRLAAVAAGSTAFFVVLALLARPLPSRDLVSQVVLQQPLQPRAVALSFPRQTPVIAAARAPRRSTTAIASYQLASLRSADVRAATQARQERRRNVFSRFFRGIVRAVQPGPAKTEPAI